MFRDELFPKRSIDTVLLCIILFPYSIQYSVCKKRTEY